MKSASVNLLLYRPGIYLKPCLDSVLSQTYRDFELLIIDNNSGDGTVERVKNIMADAKKNGFWIPEWRLMESDKNLGFAGGHNLGIKNSAGGLVFLLNQDIILRSDFLERMVLAFEKDSKIGSIQGKLLRLKNSGHALIETEIIDNTGLEVFKNRRIIARGQGQIDSGAFSRAEEIFGADGAAPAYRREALEEAKICLGGASGKNSALAPQFSERAAADSRCEYFDEDFFMYKEDVDLAWRLRLYGWKSWYEPNAVAWHARTAGESAATNYFGVIRERLKIGKFGKYYSFKNQRLMQIKNERIGSLVKHGFWFLPKEIASWIYVLLFEGFTRKAISALLKEAPGAWQKRKIIMARQRAERKEIERWFK